MIEPIEPCKERQAERMVAWRSTRLTRGAAPAVLSVATCIVRAIDRCYFARSFFKAATSSRSLSSFFSRFVEPFLVRVSIAIDGVSPFNSGGEGDWFPC